MMKYEQQYKCNNTVPLPFKKHFIIIFIHVPQLYMLYAY